jgi:hypothetical protein
MEPRFLAPLHREQQATGQSVEAPNVNSLTLDNLLRIVTVVEQLMTEFNGAVSEGGGENSGHYKNCLKSHEAK